PRPVKMPVPPRSSSNLVTGFGGRPWASAGQSRSAAAITADEDEARNRRRFMARRTRESNTRVRRRRTLMRCLGLSSSEEYDMNRRSIPLALLLMLAAVQAAAGAPD